MLKHTWLKLRSVSTLLRHSSQIEEAYDALNIIKAKAERDGWTEEQLGLIKSTSHANPVSRKHDLILGVVSGLQLRHKKASEEGMNKATYMQLSGTVVAMQLHDKVRVVLFCHTNVLSKTTTQPRCSTAMSHETKIRRCSHLQSAVRNSWHLGYTVVAIVASGLRRSTSRRSPSKTTRSPTIDSQGSCLPTPLQSTSGRIRICEQIKFVLQEAKLVCLPSPTRWSVMGLNRRVEHESRVAGACHPIENDVDAIRFSSLHNSCNSRVLRSNFLIRTYSPSKRSEGIWPVMMLQMG